MGWRHARKLIFFNAANQPAECFMLNGIGLEARTTASKPGGPGDPANY